MHLASANQLSDWAEERYPRSPNSFSRRILAGTDDADFATPRACSRGSQRRIADYRPESAASSDCAGTVAEVWGGVAAPSANRFGRVSPTRAEHVAEELGAAWMSSWKEVTARWGWNPPLSTSLAAARRLASRAVTREQLEDLLGEKLSEIAELRHVSAAAWKVITRREPPWRSCPQTRSTSGTRNFSKPGELRWRSRPGPTPFAKMIAAPVEPVAFARRLYDMLREAIWPGLM